MEQVNKIRVAMICHFSTSEVRSHLPLDDRKFYTVLRRLLGMPTKGRGYGDIAPWDKSTISFFRGRDDIDLYVVSAHSGLKKRVVSFEEQGVHYSFVRCDGATMLKRIIPNDNLWRKMNPMIRMVHRLLFRIEPDIVLLMGLENAYYSSTVLGIKDYPVYSLCQTVYNNPERAIYGGIDSKNATTEIEILNEHHYFGVYCKKHYSLLKRLAPNSYIFKFGFPSQGKLLEPVVCQKKFDFINFALGMSDHKGFTDAIEATAIIKTKYPDVTLNLVGGGSSEQKDKLQKLAIALGLVDNVVFTPFFEKQNDLFLHIQQSRFAVLPCKMDNTSGTMIQAMQLGLPIVVYETAGTLSFNRKTHCALIAKHGNVQDLASKMLLLLENPELAEALKKNARELQEERIEMAGHNGEKLVENLKSIISNFKDNTPIPREQLFNPERDD